MNDVKEKLERLANDPYPEMTDGALQEGLAYARAQRARYELRETQVDGEQKLKQWHRYDEMARSFSDALIARHARLHAAPLEVAGDRRCDRGH